MQLAAKPSVGTTGQVEAFLTEQRLARGMTALGQGDPRCGSVSELGPKDLDPEADGLTLNRWPHSA